MFCSLFYAIKLRLISNIMLWLPLSRHLYFVKQHFLWQKYKGRLELISYAVFVPRLHPFEYRKKNGRTERVENQCTKLIAFRHLKCSVILLGVYFTLYLYIWQWSEVNCNVIWESSLNGKRICFCLLLFLYLHVNIFVRDELQSFSF